MKIKRTLRALLAACLALLLLAPPAAAENRERSYAREEVMGYALKAMGLFRGYSDSNLGLDAVPTRVEALVMLLRLMGLEEAALREGGRHPFTDTGDYAWADPYIGYAYQHDLTFGQSATVFGGNAPTDMRTYLTLVLRALGYTEGEGGDFRWSSPVQLAQQVGIAPDYARYADFRRADLVIISYAALSAHLAGSTVTLAQSLTQRGVLPELTLSEYYDPAAVRDGVMHEPYAGTIERYRCSLRLPEGVDVSGLPVTYFGEVALVGDAAYELFTFNESGARAAAEQIAQGAEAVDGAARVFALIVPNRLGAVLSYTDAARLRHTQKTETEAIEYAYGLMGDKVVTVDVMTPLRLHNDEYIFFRTDHHWTALGSYYAYQAWAEAAGLAPVPLSEFDVRPQLSQLGYFYTTCGKPAAMARNPDTIIAYMPHSSLVCEPANAMSFTGWGYNVFLGGDRAITTITNNDIADDSACVLVKDSYGNPFAVWLTQHYHTVYAIDYRYYMNTAGFLNFSQFAGEKGVQDFIVLLPMTLSQAEATSGYLSNYCQ